MAFQLNQPFDKVAAVKIAYNVGCLFDVPSGKIHMGMYGESILNGGLTHFTGIVAIPNTFKTAIADYFGMSTLDRFPEATLGDYDTEESATEERRAEMAERFDNLSGENNPIHTGRWALTNSATYPGNKWYQAVRSFLKEKRANQKALMRETPFVDRDGTHYKSMVPTINIVDSLTKFEIEDVMDMITDNEIGDSAQNTSYMKSGGAKSRFVGEIPRVAVSSENPFIMTAHIGKTIAMDPRAPQVKKLQYLKNGDVIKGVSDQFLFLTHLCWQGNSATPFLNDGTKGPEYPSDTSDNAKGDTDLNLVTLTVLRNKVGRTGMMMQILVSQSDGVLPALSEFHYIKTNARFGLGGNDRNYYVELLPDVSLSRTTVRGKLASNAKLRRAVNILAEIQQSFMLWSDMEKYECTGKELYDGLIALGYDWNTILDTRGWWTFDNHKQRQHYLSFMDILKMRIGEYIPYWMKTPPQAAIDLYNKSHAVPWAPVTI